MGLSSGWKYPHSPVCHLNEIVLKISWPQLQVLEGHIKVIGELPLRDEFLWKENCLLILMHFLYSRHPNGPLKTHTGTRRARPRSVFNVRLFNGNLESFIKVPITSLPAWHCSSSYLFPVLLWLSGHFGGFPQSILALVYLKKQQQICTKIDFGNLSHE